MAMPMPISGHADHWPVLRLDPADAATSAKLENHEDFAVRFMGLHGRPNQLVSDQKRYVLTGVGCIEFLEILCPLCILSIIGSVVRCFFS